MTNLEKEISISLKTTEEAVLFWHLVNASPFCSLEQYTTERVDEHEGLTLENLAEYKNALWETINNALYDQNINPHKPPKGKLASVVNEKSQGEK